MGGCGGFLRALVIYTIEELSSAAYQPTAEPITTIQICMLSVLCAETKFTILPEEFEATVNKIAYLRFICCERFFVSAPVASCDMFRFIQKVPVIKFPSHFPVRIMSVKPL